MVKFCQKVCLAEFKGAPHTYKKPRAHGGYEKREWASQKVAAHE